MPALDAIADWPVPTAAAAVVGPSGVLAEHGDTTHRFALASVTKPLVARAAQVAVEEGVRRARHRRRSAGFDGAAPAGARLGYSMHSAEVMSPAGQAPGLLQLRVCGCWPRPWRRQAGIEFGRYLAEAVFEPLGMAATRTRRRRAGGGLRRHLDRGRPGGFRRDLLRPATGVGADARRGHCGAVPRAGRRAARVRRTAAQRLGPGFRDPRRQIAALDRIGQLPAAPTAISASQGRLSGSIPDADLALVVLTDRDFGDWATAAAGPALS